MRHEESKIQQSFIKWIRHQYPYIICFAIPNGGNRSKIEAAIMKGEGVLAGVADLFIMKPNTKKHGLFIEVKTLKGKLTKSQEEFKKNSISNRYEYVICRNLYEFINTVDNYLSQ